MRIACLLPSATDICIALGLSDFIVGITHECDYEGVLKSRTKRTTDDNNDAANNTSSTNVHILTSSGFTSTTTDTDKEPYYSQSDIDSKVKTEARKNNDKENIRNNSKNTLFDNDIIHNNSLYPINSQEFALAQPTIVLTQNLCSVCAPSPNDVHYILQKIGRENDDDEECFVYSLNPHSLTDVAETFAQVGRICGVPEKGNALRDSFLTNLDALQQITTSIQKQQYVNKNQTNVVRLQKKKRVLLLEWLDPPYDGGHWIPDMIEMVGCQVAQVVQTIDNDDDKSESAGVVVKKKNKKSKQITWDDVYKSDPDVVLIACCGFNLERNTKDALSASSKLKSMRAARNGNVYACNGDRNFARPGPLLLEGVTVIARCAYDGNENVVKALEGLDFCKTLPLQWERVPMNAMDGNCLVGDIEDMAENSDFDSIHNSACEKGEMTYTDPESGFQVFTELAHKKRGKCCGSGCRHCPFNHVNVKDKASKIKQPAFLYEGGDEKETKLETLLQMAKNVKILFFSGGKDSFLTVRRLFQSHYKNDGSFLLILLTTFDSTSRIIAHQEVHIDQVIRQAKHLKIPLIGVPMHRGSSESYVKRIQRSLDYITERMDNADKISSICFGDLHLEHIRGWRQDEISKLGFKLEYPIWKVSYNELVQELEKSGVSVVVTATTRQGVKVGDVFDSDLRAKVEGLGMDGFGENGEFHSIAKVWVVSRIQALDINDH